MIIAQKAVPRTVLNGDLTPDDSRLLFPPQDWQLVVSLHLTSDHKYQASYTFQRSDGYLAAFSRPLDFAQAQACFSAEDVSQGLDRYLAHVTDSVKVLKEDWK